MRRMWFARPVRGRARRPRLCGEALEDRTQPAVLSFAAALDTEIASPTPTIPAGANPLLRVEMTAATTRQALIRFANLFGPGPGQIPPGSTINAASLTLWVNTPGQLAPIELHRLAVAWDPATATWNTFGGNGIQADGGEALAVADGSVTTPTATGYQIVGGLQGAVQAWAAGGNNGWALLAGGGLTGWSMASADATAPDRRPLLTVDFTPANAPANPTYQQLAGTPPAVHDSAWFTWESNLQAQRLARVPSARAKTFYFAQNGNDTTGTGAIDNPWKSLAKAQAVLNASAGDVRLRFRGGDVWREPVSLAVLRSNVTVDSYGDGAALFSRFIWQYTTGWTRVSGNLWKRAESNPVGWVRQGADTAYPFNHVYTRMNTSATVGATAYSFYADANGSDPNSVGAATLYLNAGPSVDPNALAGGFEAAPFGPGWAVVDGDNVRLENLRLHGYGMNVFGDVLPNYGLYIGLALGGEAALVNVDVFYAGYHAIGAVGLANLVTCVGCRAGLCSRDLSGGLTVYVSFADRGGQEMILADSEVGYGALPDSTWTASGAGRNGTGIYDHTGASGSAGLIVALRTRYPDHPWQVAIGTWVGAAVVGRVEDARAFVVGEAPAAKGVYPPLGDAAYYSALANCQYDFGTYVGTPGVNVAVWTHACSFWAYNCSFRVDASNTRNYGAGFAWFYGYGTPVGPVCINCRFDMVVSQYEFGAIVANFNTPLADTIQFQNCVFSFTGVRPAIRGNAGLTGAKFDHNAVYVETGGVADFTAGDAAAVVLDGPPDPGAPSLTSKLRGAGAVNGVNYDLAGVLRPAGAPPDIGPRAVLPPPGASAGNGAVRPPSVRR